MEIPAWSYSLFWTTIGVVFSRLGFNALDKTELSSSVSPALISFLKHSLALSALCSSIYSFLFSPRLKIPINKYLISYAIAVWIIIYYPGISSPYWYFLVFTLCNIFSVFVMILEPSLSSSRTSPEYKLGLIVQLAVGSSVVLVGNKTKFFPCTILSIALFISTCLMMASENESFQKLAPLAAKAKEILSILKKKKKKKGKLIEFGIGMMGTILFQNFFRLTSLNHVVAFLYLAVAWVANLALLRAFDDLGIFHFLLSNVIVGCTVSQFGLRGTTWLVYGASLFLFGLRLKLDSVTLVRNEGEAEVIVW